MQFGIKPWLVLCSLALVAAGCEVGDPPAGAKLHEKTLSEATPALPTLDIFGNGTGARSHFYDGQNLLALTIYDARLPAGTTAPKGIAFYVHGGAFAAGSRTDIHDVARRMWSQGWTLVSLDYRLARWDTTLSGNVAVNTFPAAIHDVKRALRWVKNHFRTGQTGLPIIGIGHSAGSQLIQLAVTSALQAGETAPLVNLDANPADPLRTTIDTRLDGAIAIAGPGDFETVLAYMRAQPTGNALTQWTRDAFSAYLGCRVKGDLNTCDANIVRSASANAYFNAGDPPIYAAYAEADPLVPPRLGCSLGTAYTYANQFDWYWMDVVHGFAPAGPNTTLAAQHTWLRDLSRLFGAEVLIDAEHHFVLGLNTEALDFWVDQVSKRTLPRQVPQGWTATVARDCR